MRLPAIVLLLLAVSFSALAEPRGLTRVQSNGDTVADLVKRMERLRDEARANVISVDWDYWVFLIPAAGSLPGANGTYFRSDMSIANRSDVEQRITIAWFARGVNNAADPVQTFTIPANYTVMERDFVARVLGKSGLGSILVVGVDSAGNIDEDAQIDGFSRIWTPQPNASGTVSQEFTAVDIEDTLAGSWGYGLRQDSGFRTNVGLVNIWDTPNDFTIEVVGVNGRTTFTKSILPYSMDQVAIPAGNWGDLFVYIESGPSNFNWWTAYGVSVDNITGDGWISHVH